MKLVHTLGILAVVWGVGMLGCAPGGGNGSSNSSSGASSSGPAASGMGSGSSTSGSTSSTGSASTQFIPVAAAPPCTVALVNGVAPVAGQVVGPGDDVVLSAAMGPSGTASYRWSLSRVAPGSFVQVVSPSAQATALVGRLGHGVDVPGYYVFKVEALSAGGTSLAQTTCSLRAIPKQGLYVSLGWDTVDTDVDLRLVRKRPMDRFCDEQATNLAPSQVPVLADCGPNGAFVCAYENCKANMVGGMLPDFDASGGVSAGDPTLLLDALQGDGLEALHIPTPTENDLLLVAHYYSDHANGPSSVTMQVHVGGLLRGQYTANLSDGQYQPMAVVKWRTSGDVCIKDARTGEEACAAVPQCAPVASCAQCTTNGDCGQGTQCNTPTSLCEGVTPDACTDNTQCGGLLCVPLLHQCRAGGCDSCAGQNVCDEARQVCVRPPPVCMEVDEPNNDDAHALMLDAANAMGVRTGSSAVCRGDADHFTYTPATSGFDLVRFGSLMPTALVTARLVQSGVTLAFLGSNNAMGASVVAGTPVYVVVGRGTAAATDLETVSFTVERLDLSSCLGEAGEPNNTLMQGRASIIMPGDTQRALCGPADLTDIHAVQVPANKVMTVTLTPTRMLTMNLAMLDTTGAVIPSSDPAGSTMLRASSSPREVLLRVRMNNMEDLLLEPEPYTLTVVFSDPPVCLDAAFEPNDVAQDAVPLASNMFSGVACEPADVDMVSFTTTGAGPFSATLSIPTGTEVDLYLRDGEGLVVGMGTQPANPNRLVVPNLAAGPYTLEVRPHTLRPAAYPLDYVLVLDAVGLEPPVVSSSSGTPSSAGNASSGTASGTGGASSSTGPSSVGTIGSGSSR